MSYSLKHHSVLRRLRRLKTDEKAQFKCKYHFTLSQGFRKVYYTRPLCGYKSFVLCKFLRGLDQMRVECLTELSKVGK